MAFFQLEMQGGIFHSCCSLTVIYRKQPANTIQLCSIHPNSSETCSVTFVCPLYLSAGGMHDRGGGRRRSSRNLLVNPEKYNHRITQRPQVGIRKILLILIVTGLGGSAFLFSSLLTPCSSLTLHTHHTLMRGQRFHLHISN